MQIFETNIFQTLLNTRLVNWHDKNNLGYIETSRADI